MWNVFFSFYIVISFYIIFVLLSCYIYIYIYIYCFPKTRRIYREETGNVAGFIRQGKVFLVAKGEIKEENKGGK